MKQIRKRLTYANVMSSIAVFLVIGGGAAFAALGKNTVGTKQLKKNAVKTAKIGPGAVKTGKLGKEAVKAGKLANGAVLTDKLANDSVLTDKLANDAVTTGKIANDAVTGAKVNESTLGKVPQAQTADSVASSASGVALAGATISVGGVVSSWFNRLGGKPTVSHTAASGLYDIDFPGISIDTDGDDFIQQATLKGTAFGGGIRISGIEGDARIRTANSAGAATDSAFSYAVFGAQTE